MRILFFLLVFLSFSFVFSSENCSVQYHPPVLLNSQVICKRNETYTVIETDPDATGAKCLDGSIYKFLFHEGEGTDSKKFLFYFQGGMFLDVFNSASECHLFRYFFQKLADLINASSSELYGKCKYRGSLDVWKCMLPQYMYKNVEIPFFIANSQHDIIQLVNFNGIYCLDYGGGPLFCNETEQKLITKFRQTHLKVLVKMKKNQPFWGFWLRTCFEHTYHPTWGWYGSTMNVFNAELGISMSFREALDYWYYNLNKPADNYCSFIDIVDWKHNPFCVYDEIYRDQDKSS